ncbi:MAG: hypothetical protein ACI9TV_002371 [Sulfurimonas sp.]|jgi:hypothetical protein|uniref:hypothetical protein n=1 Tax=Sulfurimonas sp. TaxID=2022749 RepID=UPI0039E35060
MYSLRLDIDNSVDSRFSSFVEQFKKEDFLVSSVKDVQKRVADAEKNENFSSDEDFWSNIDKKVKGL